MSNILGVFTNRNLTIAKHWNIQYTLTLVLLQPTQGGRPAKGQKWKQGDQMVHSTCAWDKRDGHYGYRNSVKTDGQTDRPRVRRTKGDGHGRWGCRIRRTSRE